MKLIDANVLIYALDNQSPHHGSLKGWLERVYLEDDVVGLPRMSLLAFIRITTNPRIMSTALSSEQALSCVQSLLSHPKSVILSGGPNHWQIFRRVVSSSGVFGPAVTDAYMAALAIEHGCLLCSTDQGFRRFRDLKFMNPLE